MEQILAKSIERNEINGTYIFFYIRIKFLIIYARRLLLTYTLIPTKTRFMQFRKREKKELYVMLIVIMHCDFSINGCTNIRLDPSSATL